MDVQLSKNLSTSTFKVVLNTQKELEKMNSGSYSIETQQIFFLKRATRSLNRVKCNNLISPPTPKNEKKTTNQPKQNKQQNQLKPFH